MDLLDGIWRLVDSRAWDEDANPLSAPFGQNPMGQIMFSNGRMPRLAQEMIADTALTAATTPSMDQRWRPQWM